MQDVEPVPPAVGVSSPYLDHHLQEGEVPPGASHVTLVRAAPQGP